jgi:predicted RND superfamily exporter protein
MDRFARWLVRHPFATVLVYLLITALLAVSAWRIRIEGSLESVLPGRDPSIEYYRSVRATFGSDDVAVVGILSPDLFSNAVLAKIDRVTTRLAAIEGVDRVMSLTNAVDPSADVFDPPPLVPRHELSPEEVEALKQKLAGTPLYAHNLVARDFKGAAINLFFKDLSDAQYADLGIDDQVARIIAEESGPEEFLFTGAGHIKQAVVDLMREDLLRFTPIALALVLLILWLSFRRFRAILLPLVCVTSAVVWTLGAMALLGKSINLGTFVLPPLLLVIGSSYAVHLLARYYEHVAVEPSHDEAVVRTIEHVWLPLVISAFTTAIGFGALAVNRITAIRDLGVFSVLGLVSLVIGTLTFLPAALLLRQARALKLESANLSPRLGAVLERLGALARAGRVPILIAATLIAIAAAFGTRFIEVDSDFLAYFEPSSPVRQANERINREIVGSNPFYLVVEGSTAGTLQRWEVLREIKDLQIFLAKLPGVTGTLSIVDYLEMLQAGLNQGEVGDLVVDDEGRVVPAEPPKSFWDDPKSLGTVIAMATASPKTFQSVVNRDFSRGNIIVRTRLSGSRQIEETLGRIREYIRHHFPAGTQVRPTGDLVLLTGTSSDIVAGQVRSLSLALAVIFVVLVLMFLSVRVGVLAILPNILPILLFFGILGWAGIDLNLGTSLIATIALGIAVDSTIHYMARLSRELKRHENQAEAMDRTMGNVGVPIVYTTTALFLGFLTFAWSGFVPIENFGIMTAATLAAALAANLVVLPAMLATTRIITLWDLVTVRLGEDPGRTIPLLNGLRPMQARIVVLMGKMRSFEPGEFIVRRGDLGHEMFVIIDGTTEVLAGSGEERRRVAQHNRGDVFGEMALVRRNERSADVIAVDRVDVLVVDERFLDRIQRRYPRIASKIFLNLTRILSDRLQRMTDQFISASRG